MQKKVAELEENFRKNDSYNLFKSVKDLDGKQKRSPFVIKDDNGIKHFKPAEILKLCEDHFKVHLNTSFPHNEEALNKLNHSPINEDLDDSEITKKEIQEAMTKVKNKKVPGLDSVTIKAIKAGGEKIIDALHKLFNTI